MAIEKLTEVAIFEFRAVKSVVEEAMIVNHVLLCQHDGLASSPKEWPRTEGAKFYPESWWSSVIFSSELCSVQVCCVGKGGDAKRSQDLSNGGTRVLIYL